MSGWNQAPLPRDQILLFRETLGDRIAPHHSVRLLWEILDGLDWAGWERHYVLVAGQPPIHPKVMAGAILYGLTHGIRSSRRLEWACGHAVDFLWLVEGRTIEHSTFCDFRTRFKQGLKDLFRQIGRVAMHMGLVSLNQVAFDGTRVKANSSMHATASAKTLEQRLAALDEQVERMLAESDEVDGREKDLFGAFGENVSTTTLPPGLRDLTQRQERLRKALQAAQQADAKRQKQKGGSKRAAKVPVADPDSAIMPNKEGGHAPNFNPVAAVDGVCGMIVDTDVLDEMKEAETVIPTIERIELSFGKKPEQFLADSAFATGENLSRLAAREIEALMPVEQTLLPADNPAEREDPSVPVPEADWAKLPRRAQTRKWNHRQDACATIPGITGRMPVPQCATAVRLKTEAGRAAYACRAHLAETPNAVIKQVMGLRQFLHRGLEKVRTEWLWACTAFNLRKLFNLLRAVRAEGTIEMG